MKRGILVLVVLLALSLLVNTGIALASPGYKVTLRVIDENNNPLESATVEVFYQSGSRVVSGATNTTGYFTFEILSNGTYVVVVSKKYYIMDYFTVAGADVSKTLNLTSGYYKLNVTSTPITVAFNISLTAASGVIYENANTNVTVFIPAGENVRVAFPKEVQQTIYKYTFDKLKYDYTETTNNYVTLTMSTNRAVIAYYTKTFAITLEYWVVALLVVIIVIALFVAWRAGAKTAKEMIEEYREKTRKFVKRK